MELIHFVFILINCAVLSLADCRGRSHVIREGKEYQLFFEKASWMNASRKCESWGVEWNSVGRASLVNILTEDVQTCVREMVASQPRNITTVDYFIGGSKGLLPGGGSQWIWNNGQRIRTPEENGTSFEEWAKMRAPVNSSTACLSALKRSRSSLGIKAGDWFPKRCNRKMFFICERRVSESLIWGFSGNKHAVAPDNWHTLPGNDACAGTSQSPRNLPTSEISSCQDGEVKTRIEWKTENNASVSWEIRNTGRLIEIRFNPPRTLYTSFGPNGTKHYVDYVHLKWGPTYNTGSEHTVGGLRHAGELQIFHYPNDQGERHAIAFLLLQHHFVQNKRWASLLFHVSAASNVGSSVSMTSPKKQFRTLLEDSNTESSSVANSILHSGIRYRGSLTHPPCTENVIWTVFTNPIRLAANQINVLREHIYMEGTQNGQRRMVMATTRPIISEESRYCQVSSFDN